MTKCRWDEKEVVPTTRFCRALIEVMKATCEMVSASYDFEVEDWTWGRCMVGNLAEPGGLAFQYGGADCMPNDGHGQFAVVFYREGDRDKLLTCPSCGPTPHRFQPSPEAGPFWRCSECGKTAAEAIEDMRAQKEQNFRTWLRRGGKGT